MKKTIEVKTKHIKSGEPTNAALCPIALALHDAGFKNVRVEHEEITFLREDDIDEYFTMPKKAVIFIHNFDNGHKVKPFKFQLQYS